MAARNECIICFNDTYDSGDRVTINMEVDEIVSIVKNCNCKFKVHETCFLKWVNKKPVCPYCRAKVTVKPRYTKTTIIKTGLRCESQRIQSFLFLTFISMMALVIVVSGS
jgi:hypothetical protein